MEETEQSRATQTYQQDLAQAMNATDAPVVQELLAHAREQEAEAAIAVVEQKERKWYGLTSLILVILTVVVIAAGAWYYLHLTVPIQPASSVGAFQHTEAIVASKTSIEKVISDLAASSLPEGKPILVNLTETQGGTLLTNTELYAFIGAAVPEPLQSSVAVARLAAINTGTEVLPFIIMSVPNPEKASQELTNAEPSLLKLFYRALGIRLSDYVSNPLPSASALIPAGTQSGQSGIALAPAVPAAPTLAFDSQFFYNLPVRTLTATDPVTHAQRLAFLYGYASNNIVVMTTRPEVLKAAYDTIVNQR